MEGLITWFSRNHVAANSLMATVLLMGIATWGQLKKEIFPETAINAILIQVPFPNASPEEVETGVVIPIEEAIQDLEGIDRLTSVSNQSIASVTVEVEEGFDVRDLMADVKTRIDAIQNLAEEAEEPILQELLIKSQVLSVAVSADTDEKTLRLITERVRDGLLAYELPPGWNPFAQREPFKITQAFIAGARDYEISIEVSEQTLRQYGLTFDEVARAVQQSSIDLPGGSIRTTAGEILLRTEQRRYTAEEFSDITVVTRADGSRVKLDEIAHIRDAFEEDDITTRFDGRPALLLNVYRVGDQDTLKVAKAAKQFVYEEAPKLYPEGVRLEIWRDESVYLDGRMRLLVKNGLVGFVLLSIVLALFLRPSLALLVAIGIPASFAGAVAMMPVTGISINLISLFAFILVLGIVVDDAIVVGENVYRRIREGEHPRIASPKGTHEVGVVVVFGILTTMMAFTPMLGLSGVSGKIWPNIPLIVIPTLLFSLLQSKLVLPAHLALLRPHDPERKTGGLMRFQQFFSLGLERFVEKVHRPILRQFLHHRYIVLAAFLGVFIVTVGIMTSGWMKFQFFPEVEGDVISAKIEMPSGVPFESTAWAVRQLEEAAWQMSLNYRDNDGQPVVAHMLASVGTQPFLTGTNVNATPKGTNLGEVTLELQAAVNRDISGEELVSIWRSIAGPIPGVEQLTIRTETAAGGNAIDLELTGSNLERLEEATERVKEALRGYEGVIDIASSNREGNRELKLDILPQGEALGLRLEDVARQVRQGYYGEEVQRLQRGRDEVRVFVRYPRDERRSLSSLDDMRIRTASGAEVPFSEVAVASYGRSDASIQRSGRQRAIIITADVDAASDANATEVVESMSGPTGILTRVKREFPGVNYQFQGEQKDQNESVAEIGQRGLLALVGIYVLMAIPLRSYVQPLIVMSVIPFGVVGAVWGHILMGLNLSIMSMCGIVALSGVVVNDSLVLVDYVNRERARGHSLIEAAWYAGVARFRPILLTSMTTFAGLTPMLLETDLQARFLIPMAVSLGFGILFATVITLVLIPSIYLILHDIMHLGDHDKAKLPGHHDYEALEATR